MGDWLLWAVFSITEAAKIFGQLFHGKNLVQM
jgi:hypothetical protein